MLLNAGTLGWVWARAAATRANRQTKLENDAARKCLRFAHEKAEDRRTFAQGDALIRTLTPLRGSVHFRTKQALIAIVVSPAADVKVLVFVFD
jgi:hypothetical protein